MAHRRDGVTAGSTQLSAMNAAFAGASDDIGDQMPDDEQEPLLLMDLPPDALHAIARQLVCMQADVHTDPFPHLSDAHLSDDEVTAEARSVLKACEAYEKLHRNADGHESSAREVPHRCSGWACGLTSLCAVKHMTMLCTGLRSTLLADEVLWSMLRRRRGDVLTNSAPLSSLPRLTPDAVAASMCSAHIVPHGTPLSMPLSDAVEIETWQATEEQARHCRRARTHARSHPLILNPPTHQPSGARVAVRARRAGRGPRVAGEPPQD